MDDLLEVELAADREVLRGALDTGKEAIGWAIGGAAASYGWPRLCGELAGTVLRELRDNWLGWVVDGWCLAREIKAHAEPARAASGATATVKLGRHKLDFTLPLEAKVSCAGIEAPPIGFDVKLTADIHAVTLVIRRGHVVAIEGGQCEVKAKILFLTRPLCDDMSLKTLKLPAKREFAAPGLKIPGAPTARPAEPVPLVATMVAPPAP